MLWRWYQGDGVMWENLSLVIGSGWSKHVWPFSKLNPAVLWVWTEGPRLMSRVSAHRGAMAGCTMVPLSHHAPVLVCLILVATALDWTYVWPLGTEVAIVWGPCKDWGSCALIVGRKQWEGQMQGKIRRMKWGEGRKKLEERMICPWQLGLSVSQVFLSSKTFGNLFQDF